MLYSNGIMMISASLSFAKTRLAKLDDVKWAKDTGCVNIKGKCASSMIIINGLVL